MEQVLTRPAETSAQGYRLPTIAIHETRKTGDCQRTGVNVEKQHSMVHVCPHRDGAKSVSENVLVFVGIRIGRRVSIYPHKLNVMTIPAIVKHRNLPQQRS